MQLIHKILQTWIATLSNRFVINLATLGPIGQKLKAPGTMGSVAGFIGYSVFFAPLAPFSLAYLLLLLFFTWLAVLFCGEAEIRLRKKDPSEVILDEFIAIPYCFIGFIPSVATWNDALFTLIAFVLFRFFDIVKPLGIKKLQAYSGGLGVVIDDVVAGIYTCICLHLLKLMGI